MSAENDIRNTAQDLLGKGKEAVGKLTDNDKLVAEGKKDQAEATLKKGVENVKDAASVITKKLGGKN
jgi:uncharacterized protein YjbJ (UPF0337 family)